jgi:hypothetical protein
MARWQWNWFHFTEDGQMTVVLISLNSRWLDESGIDFTEPVIVTQPVKHQNFMKSRSFITVLARHYKLVHTPSLMVWTCAFPTPFTLRSTKLPIYIFYPKSLHAFLFSHVCSACPSSELPSGLLKWRWKALATKHATASYTCERQR